MVTVSVRGLPRSMNEQTLESLFAEHGRVFKMKLIKDLFSGQCKGIAELEMEGHEARAAKEAIDGRAVDGSFVRVFVDTKGAAPRGKGRRGR
ncbi:MAG TPA: RNA-binding protein [Xanthomonadaceae bacterium]|nr:RNA-binding protein [Xanthomonadaceae bacterium]